MAILNLRYGSGGRFPKCVLQSALYPLAILCADERSRLACDRRPNFENWGACPIVTGSKSVAEWRGLTVAPGASYCDIPNIKLTFQGKTDEDNF